MSDLAISSGTSSAALHSQMQKLKQQCADWQGCTTTPTGDKQKILGELRGQIQTLEAQAQQLDQTQRVEQPTQVDQGSVGNGVNRPIDGSVAGGSINLSV